MSQRVWTCACGWRSIAENVGGPGQQGEAPPHCRRCKSQRLSVTSEKHPKITQVCKACREDFVGHVGAKHCPKCMSKERGKRIWDGRRKYEWTPERDQLLRDHYKRNATEIAKQFFPGWPKWAITHRVQQLGLARTKEKPWTKAEDAFLLEWAGVHTPTWMQKQLTNRTVTAIVVRLKRLNVSRRIQSDGLTLMQLEQALGVDHRHIAAWWKSGRLKGRRRETDRIVQGDPYVFEESDVAEFLLANPSAFRLDRVDQAWFMGLMRDAIGQKASAAPRQRSEPTAIKAPRRAATPAAPVAAADTVPCVGANSDTPCPNQKQVVARPHIPPRCPDCMLALRRQLHSEENSRLRRIRATRAPERQPDVDELLEHVS
jgi:hypothetical protein